MTDRYIGKKFNKNLITSSLVCVTCVSVAFGPFKSYSSVSFRLSVFVSRYKEVSSARQYKVCTKPE